LTLPMLPLATLRTGTRGSHPAHMSSSNN
jgi:hypothetical protein